MINTRDKFSKHNKIMDELQSIENQQGNGVLPCVVGSALLPQYCKDCNNHPCDDHDKHIKCKQCYFIGNKQSNFERKSV